MGGRQVGRSEPAFRVASTTALPPPTCTARQEAGQRRLLAVLLLRGLYRLDRRQLFFKACAGRIVRRLCLPAAALFSRLCLPVHLCHPCLLPSTLRLPHSVLISPPLFITMCARIVVQVCKDCPVGSYNTGLQWRPVRRFFTFDFTFFLQSP